MPTLNELGQLVKQKYPGVYDDLDDVTLAKQVQAKFPDAYTDYTEAPAVISAPPSLGTRAAQALPAIGGMVGGFFPGPAGIAAAGAGQALGELGRQAFTGPPGIEDWSNVGKEGLKGAAFGAAGGAAGKLVGATARGAYAIGARISPKVASTLSKYGIVAKGGKFGVDKLEKVYNRVGESAKQLYTKLDAQIGDNLPVAKLTEGVQKLISKLPDSREKAAFTGMIDDFIKSHPEKVNASTMRTIKQRFQKMVNYETDKLGPQSKEFAKKVAVEARRSIVKLGEVGKQIAKKDAELGRLKVARRVLRKIPDRVPGAGTGPFQPIAGAIEGTIGNPALLSSLALLLGSTAPVANFGTRALGNLILPPQEPAK